VVRRINLVPPSERPRTTTDFGVLLLIVAVVIVIAALAFGYYSFKSSLSSKQDELAAVQQQNAQLQGQLETRQQYEALQGTRVQAEKVVQGIYAGRTIVSDILDELSLVVPDTAWFLDLTLTTPDPVPPEAGAPPEPRIPPEPAASPSPDPPEPNIPPVPVFPPAGMVPPSAVEPAPRAPPLAPMKPSAPASEDSAATPAPSTPLLPPPPEQAAAQTPKLAMNSVPTCRIIRDLPTPKGYHVTFGWGKRSTVTASNSGSSMMGNRT